MADTPIKFYFNYEVGDGQLRGESAPYKFYSPDGATWELLSFTQVAMLEMLIGPELVSYFIHFDWNEWTASGSDSDLFHFVIFVPPSYPGLAPGFNSELYYVETKFDSDDIGKTFCLDTTRIYDPELFLIWATTLGIVFPSWDGPHCFEIVDCCSGNRGDVNGDGVGPNILDLTLLVDYVFRGAPAPDCQLESDVNGDGMPYNIIDLTFVVDFVFRSGQPAPACPS
ncbi:MAG: hypothetical protein IH931_07610 [candidate division Zixibacteria bacterium]|nr:hypothetical protein [candidate division Zixibacteria bacterium]